MTSFWSYNDIILVISDEILPEDGSGDVIW